jgi:hypothetical protein
LEESDIKKKVTWVFQYDPATRHQILQWESPVSKTKKMHRSQNHADVISLHQGNCPLYIYFFKTNKHLSSDFGTFAFPPPKKKWILDHDNLPYSAFSKFIFGQNTNTSIETSHSAYLA